MLARSLLLTAAIGLTAAGPAGAAPPAFVGPSSGATATRTGDTLTVTLTPAARAAARAKAGTMVAAGCSKLPSPGALPFAGDGLVLAPVGDDASGEAKLGADGIARIRLTSAPLGFADDPSVHAPVPAVDVCELDAEAITHATKADSSVTILAFGEVGTTPAGVVHADEAERAIALRRAITAARDGDHYRPAAAVAGVVALAAPADSAPAGAIGYWTDGARATVTTTSAAGRRLAIEDSGGLTLHTNVLLQSDPYGRADVRSGDVADDTDRPAPDQDRSESPLHGGSPASAADGVRVARHGARLTLRFTGASAKLERRLAGRRVSVTCTPSRERTLFARLAMLLVARPDTAVSRGVVRVPRAGGPLSVTLRGTARPDNCVVTDDGLQIAAITPTAAGRADAEDLAAAELLGAAVDRAVFAPAGATAYRSPAQIAAAAPKLLVALSGPTAPAPSDRAGVWTDGAHQALIEVRSATGRVYRYADTGEGDDYVSLNAFGPLTSGSLETELAGLDFGDD